MTHLMCSASWTEELSLAKTIQFLTEQALVHCRHSGPHAIELEKYLEQSDWRAIVDFTVDYSSGTPTELYHVRQALAFFQKLEALPLNVDKESVAFDKFREAEYLCGLTNKRLERADPVEIPTGVASVLLTAQRKISAILGRIPHKDELNLAFGPGANVGIKSPHTSARWKLDDPLRCSTNMAPVLQWALEGLPQLCQFHRVYPTGLVSDLEDQMDRVSVVVEIAEGNLSFVEKNAKTYRSIVVEPPLNTLYQKGCGSYIRSRLRKAGLDLDTCAMRNRAYAQASSVNGRLATVDLSMASDTLSKGVVQELLPLDWVSFLSNFRTGSVRYRNQSIHLNKFSSMGNGYTFELESLIFYALAWACAANLSLDCSEVTSFGDDIIIPTEAVGLLTETFNYLGFKINHEKTFVAGRFRESCGGDYVDGIEIRPYYQKGLVSGQTLFALHNFYVRSLQPEMAAHVLSFIHPSLLLWGPDGYGDGHLIGSWEHVAKKSNKTDFCGVTFETFTLKPLKSKRRCKKGDRILPAYSIYVSQQDHLSYLEGATKLPPSDLGLSPDHLVIRGNCGYKRISIYTFCDFVLCRS